MTGSGPELHRCRSTKTCRRVDRDRGVHSAVPAHRRGRRRLVRRHRGSDRGDGGVYGRALGFGGMPVNTAGDVAHIQAHGTQHASRRAQPLRTRGTLVLRLRGRRAGRAFDHAPDEPRTVHARGCSSTSPQFEVRTGSMPRAPVGGDDIDAALSAAKTTFEPGDALLLYMGRNRWEAAGGHFNPFSRTPTPGGEQVRRVGWSITTSRSCVGTSSTRWCRPSPTSSFTC